MGLESVDRMVAVLDAVADGAVTLPEICDRTGLAKSTASRFLAALGEHDLIYRADDSTFAIGSGLDRIAVQPPSTARLIDACRIPAGRLAVRLQEAVCLSVLERTQTRTVFQVDVEQPVLAENWVDRQWPILGTGSAASILSTWSPRTFESHLNSLPKSNRRAVAEAVDAARQKPVSWSRGTYVPDLTSASAPIDGPTGRATSALIVYGPSYRFPGDQKISRIERELTDTASEVSEALHS